MSYNIAIIGGGLAGLTAGILLKQQGARVKIYEKRAGIESIGGNLGLWPNGSKVLLNLPCAEKIRQLTKTLEYHCTADAQGNTLNKFARDLFLQVNGYPIFNICRSELHHALFSALDEDDIIFSAKLQSIDQIEADLIIGADGCYSTVRKLLFPEAQLNYAGYVALVGIYEFPNQQQPQHHFIWGKNRFFITFPISNQRHMLYLVRPLDSGQLNKHLISRKEQIALFRGWSAEVDQTLDYYTASISRPEYAAHYYCGEAYDMQPLPTWHKKNVILIGDAAHPMGSIMGLGVNLALEDAEVLVNSLYTEKNIAAALSKFESRQIPRTNAFAAVEKEQKEFLLKASEADYQTHLHKLKTIPPETDLQAFMDLLKA